MTSLVGRIAKTLLSTMMALTIIVIVSLVIGKATCTVLWEKLEFPDGSERCISRM